MTVATVPRPAARHHRRRTHRPRRRRPRPVPRPAHRRPRGRRRRRRRGPRMGPRPAVLRLVASSSTPPPRGSSRRPAGPRPDPDAYPTGADWAEQLPAARSPTRSTRPTRSRSATAPASSASPGSGRDRLVDAGARTTHSPSTSTTADRRERLARRARSSTPPAPGAAPTRSAATASPPRRDRARGPDLLRHPGLHRPGQPRRYAGKHVAVAGRGASAQNTLLGLADSPSRTRHQGHLAAAPGRRPATRSAAETTTSSRPAARSARTRRRAVEAGPVERRHLLPHR